MEVILFLMGVLAGAVVGGWGVWVWVYRKQKEVEEEVKKLEAEIENEKQEFLGLSEYNARVVEIKQQRKQKILEEIQSKGKIDAGKTADLCGVSRYSAFRYLEELEKEGKIEQKGSFGRAVEYKLK